MAEEVVKEGTTKEKKYITVTFDKEADAATLRKYRLVTKVGGFSPREIIEKGIEACINSKKYKDAANLLLKEIEQ